MFFLELDEFLQDLDEDVEGMQSTIYFLQNELQKCKASVQNINNTENKETSTKAVVNGIKSDDVVTPVTHIVTKTVIPLQSIEKILDSKSSKPDKSKDSKHLNECKPKVKKSRPVQIIEGIDKSGKPPKVHKSKHKSDGSKSEEKRIKSEKRPNCKDEVVHKKPKSDRPKSTEVKTPVTAVNGLPNGS